MAAYPILQHLFPVYTICQSPFDGMLGMIGLILQIVEPAWASTWENVSSGFQPGMTQTGLLSHRSFLET